ncbi:MAG: hypothetical protein GY731_14040, partial [Gammaproteobacteria bacterium]|nr:hypothetical protein [Gammaproteobacteria bacterium]
ISPVTFGQWVHVAFTYDFATSQKAIYLNGTLDASSNNRSNNDPGSFLLTIGTRTGKTQYFSGTMDDIRIYDRVLSVTEIGTLAQVSLPSNEAPDVNASADPVITLPDSVSLDGTVTDDGLPNPPGNVTTTWSTVSGQGTVTFGNPGAIDTTAFFSTAGNYVLRLTADDGTLSASNDVFVTVNPETPQSNYPPVAEDQSVTTNKDSPISITLIATDADGGTLTYTIVNQSANGTFYGTVPDVTYVPNAGFTGNDSFTWKANDGLADSNTATVTINVVSTDTNMVAHWKFDEDSGITTNDSSGNNLTGTLLNGPIRTTGQIGSAIQFSSGNDVVTIGGSLDPPQQGTLAFWINPSGRGRILGGHDAWEVGISNSGIFSNQLFSGGSSVLHSISPVTFGQWVHVAFTYDFATSQKAIYLNGTLDASSNNHSNNDPGSFLLTIGTRTGKPQYFAGTMDDIRIYDRVLSVTEIGT